MKLKACAKLNLALDISAKRADGYHEMHMVMQSVDLCDLISADLKKGGELKVSSSIYIQGDNIAETAVQKYTQAAGFGIGGNIHIEKHIPICGGMGGGSADAAAVLFALDKTFGATDEGTLYDIALSLGADVPFALAGGTRYVGGVGEQLKALPSMPHCHIVLCSGGIKDSTGKMFARFDAEEHPYHPDVHVVAKALDQGDLLSAAKHFGNSFEPLWSGEIMTEIGDIYNKYGCLGHALSGAGPTVFGVFSERDAADECCKQLKILTGWSEICHPTSKSITIE